MHEAQSVQPIWIGSRGFYLVRLIWYFVGLRERSQEGEPESLGQKGGGHALPIAKGRGLKVRPNGIELQ